MPPLTPSVTFPVYLLRLLSLDIFQLVQSARLAPPVAFPRDNLPALIASLLSPDVSQLVQIIGELCKDVIYIYGSALLPYISLRSGLLNINDHQRNPNSNGRNHVVNVGD